MSSKEKKKETEAFLGPLAEERLVLTIPGSITKFNFFTKREILGSIDMRLFIIIGWLVIE